MLADDKSGQRRADKNADKRRNRRIDALPEGTHGIDSAPVSGQMSDEIGQLNRSRV